MMLTRVCYREYESVTVVGDMQLRRTQCRRRTHVKTNMQVTRAITETTKLAAAVAMLLGTYACAADTGPGAPVGEVSQAVNQEPVFLEQPGSGRQRVDQAGLGNEIWVDYDDSDGTGFVKGWVTNFNDTPAWVGLYVGAKCGDATEYDWKYWEEVVEPLNYNMPDPTRDLPGVFARFVSCPENQRTAGAIYVEADANPH
jgi:hypothetical protein